MATPIKSPDAKVTALMRIEQIMEGGTGVRKAVEIVATETGISVRSLFKFRKMTDFVPRSEWPLVLARKAQPDRTRPKANCAPEALAMIVGLCRSGVGTAEAYRRMVAAARENGWAPIPSERTLRRRLTVQGHIAAGYKARRDAGSMGGDEAD